MGRLVIAHHKSYHPYRRDNIERVRQDEEEARRKEEGEDARVMLADSEARIQLLRQRTEGSRKPREREREYKGEVGPSRAVLDFEPAGSNTATEPIATTSTGHINLFADLEQQAMHSAITSTKQANKKSATEETDRGVPLAPTAKDLKPWYSSRSGEEPDTGDTRAKETREEKRSRDTMRKSTHDPLTDINSQLANHRRQVAATTQRTGMPPPLRHRTIASSSGANDAVRARLNRESNERARAEELIRRRRREMEGSMTPSTVHGGIDEGYSERFHARETDDAQKRRRERRW
ncbi:hypothetical protein BKA62DRAFT_616973 [Auriculariales sp. MPI-PUGE-AT-0066]|nr:hypothetical protein BKA62DRAFT_616973 [Auriculariales sp. MPI-PUGE-AT-0066]